MMSRAGICIALGLAAALQPFDPHATAQQGDAGPHATAQQGDAGPRASAQQGDAGPRASTQQGDAGPRASTQQGDAGPRTSAQQGDAGPRATAREEAAATREAGPRVAPIAVTEMTAAQKALLGIVDGEPLPRRATMNLFRTLAHNPELMSVYFPMGDAVNRAPQIPAKPRELVILRVAWLYRSEYEWAQHHGAALEAGWTPEEIERIRFGPDAPGWSDADRIWLQAADQLVRNARLDDDTWTALRERHSVRDIMVLITMVTHYHWVAMMTRTLGIELEEGRQGFQPPVEGDASPAAQQRFSEQIDREAGAGIENGASPAAAQHPAVLRREGFVAYVEGPAWRSDGTVFFTDVPNSRILRRNRDGRIEIHRTPSNRANGLFIDGRDRLLIAEMDGRIVRESPDGAIEVLADRFDGVPFNGPNDLALDSRGRIWFTDPAAPGRADAPQRDADGGIVDGVYRIDRPGEVARVLTHEVGKPNGILVSPGDRYLYVADNDIRPGGARKVWRFDLDSDGNVDAGSRRLVFDWDTDRGPDGMAIDESGNIYVASGLNHAMPNRTSLVYKAGIYVISPQGDLLDFIAVPMDNVSNVTFGGDDLATLYITAGHSLWSYRVGAPGYRPARASP